MHGGSFTNKLGLIAIFGWLCAGMSADVHKIDSLLWLFEEQHSVVTQIDAVNQLVAYLYEEKALETSYRFTKQTPVDSLKRTVYGGVAFYYYDRAEYQRCIRYANLALEPVNNLKDTAVLVAVLDIMAVSYIRTGLYDKAHQTLEQSLMLAERQNDDAGQGIVYSNMGALYTHMKKDSLSIVMYLKAINIARGIHDKSALAIRLSKLGEIYVRLGKPEDALPLFKEALELDTRIGNKDKIAIRQSNLASAYAEMNRYDEAEKLYLEAIETFRSLDKKSSLAISYLQMGQLQHKKEQLQQAEKYYKEAEDIAKETGMIATELATSEGLYRIYKQTNPGLAFNYIERKNLLSDSIYRLESEKQVNDFMVRYEMAEKEHQIVIHKAELRRKNQQQWVLLVVIALCLLILFIVDRYRRLVRRRNRELYEMNRTKDRLFSIISHDLKSPVMAQKRAVDGLLHKLDELSTDELKTNLYDFQHATEAELDLLQNLLSWARMQTGQMKPAPIVFDMNETVAEVARIYRMPAQHKQINLRLQTAEKCEAFADRNMIQAVLRNMLHNAIKFSHPDSEIIITTKCLEESVRVSVKDSGVGMKPEQIDAILKNRTFRSTAGTNDEKGSGLGLLICKEMLERNGSELIIRSEHGQGTEVEFELHK